MPERTPHTYALLGALREAGIEGPAELVRNEYWNNDEDPWVRVQTPFGPLVIGWRKRVIAIYWDKTTISADGREVVAEDWITYSERMCHAWGYDQAVACLQRLWAAAVRYHEQAPWARASMAEQARDLVNENVSESPNRRLAQEMAKLYLEARQAALPRR